MADNWASGDLALCIRDDWDNDGTDPRVCGAPHVARGAVREVLNVVLLSKHFPGALQLGLSEADEHLSFTDPGFNYGYRSDWFKKINPLTDDEHSAFLAELDADNPVKVGEYLGVDIFEVPYLRPNRHDRGYR